MPNVTFRECIQSVPETYKLQKFNDRNLSSCAEWSTRRLVLGNIQDLELAGKHAGEAKIALEIEDVIDKLFNSIFVEFLSDCNDMSGTSLI